MLHGMKGRIIYQHLSLLLILLDARAEIAQKRRIGNVPNAVFICVSISTRIVLLNTILAKIELSTDMDNSYLKCVSSFSIVKKTRVSIDFLCIKENK